MIDPAQIILFFSIVVLTIVFVALGIQAFFILKEFRKTVDKTNKILDDVSGITESISNPISSLSSVLTGLKTGGVLVSIIKKLEILGKGKVKNEQ